MPVRLDAHDPELELTPGTTKSDVVGFLYRNDDYGYRPREVHDELGVPHNTAKVTLKRLYDDGFVEKTADGYYHARTDREDLYRYGAALEGLDRMFTSHDDGDVPPDAEVRTDAGRESSTDLTDDAVALVDSVEEG